MPPAGETARKTRLGRMLRRGRALRLLTLPFPTLSSNGGRGNGRDRQEANGLSASVPEGARCASALLPQRPGDAFFGNPDVVAGQSHPVQVLRKLVVRILVQELYPLIELARACVSCTIPDLWRCPATSIP